MFTDDLFEETKRLGLRIIEVDTGMSEDELGSKVTQALGL